MTAFVALPASDLQTLIQTAVRDGVREALSKAQAESASPWLTPEGVAALLGYKRRSIAGLVRLRKLPCHRVGRLLRFRREEVTAWAEAGGRR